MIQIWQVPSEYGPSNLVVLALEKNDVFTNCIYCIDITTGNYSIETLQTQNNL